MFSDYKARIVEFYEQKRDDGNLSANLLHPTPRKLKDESLLLLGSRNSRDDIKTIREFCGLDEDQQDVGRALRNLDIDKFRPLVNFLKGENENPREKSIELLAWLIDFPERPVQYGKDYSKKKVQTEKMSQKEELVVELNENEKQTIVGAGLSTALTDSVDDEIQDLYPKVPWYQKNKVKRIALVVMVCTAFVFTKSSTDIDVFSIFRSKQCMYWENDHYVAVDCETKIPNITILALDEFKYNHLKKINRLDTIGPKHINKVHYSKVNNIVEFYTTKGEHPEYPDRHLKPMTGYMYEKYVAGRKK